MTVINHHLLFLVVYSSTYTQSFPNTITTTGVLLSKMSIPRGIPSVTYLRINGNQHQTGWIDVLADGPNSISIMETDQPISRHEVTQVLDRTLNDEDVCEHIIGTLAGVNLGVALNPISAFVLDAATSLILLIGSKQTKKWQFMKQIFLKFLANELYANQLADKEVQVTGFYDAQVSLTAFEINNELITDLLQPQSRGFPVSFSAEEGNAISNLPADDPFPDKL